jgi:amino-acid N-acetyltransferase
MKNFKFSFACPSHEKAIRTLLAQQKLPSQDVSLREQKFIVVKNRSRLVGCVGLQSFGKDGLLRSLAVDRLFRGKGLARELFERLMVLARQNGVKNLYLLTTTAPALFKKWGFHPLSKSKAPVAIRRTKEFAVICPATAILMRKSIREEALYYPKDMLPLKPDVKGSRMWGIALQKAMLTYFEVEPNCEFKRHHHRSEQITLVLKGELFFRMDDKTVHLQAGEAIAIPSNLPHSVYTKSQGAKAVDAWSPVMPAYRK